MQYQFSKLTNKSLRNQDVSLEVLEWVVMGGVLLGLSIYGLYKANKPLYKLQMIKKTLNTIWSRSGAIDARIADMKIALIPLKELSKHISPFKTNMMQLLQPTELIKGNVERIVAEIQKRTGKESCELTETGWRFVSYKPILRHAACDTTCGESGYTVRGMEQVVDDLIKIFVEIGDTKKLVDSYDKFINSSKYESLTASERALVDCTKKQIFIYLSAVVTAFKPVVSELFRISGKMQRIYDWSVLPQNKSTSPSSLPKIGSGDAYAVAKTYDIDLDEFIDLIESSTNEAKRRQVTIITLKDLIAWCNEFIAYGKFVKEIPAVNEGENDEEYAVRVHQLFNAKPWRYLEGPVVLNDIDLETDDQCLSNSFNIPVKRTSSIQGSGWSSVPNIKNMLKLFDTAGDYSFYMDELWNAFFESHVEIMSAFPSSTSCV